MEEVNKEELKEQKEEKETKVKEKKVSLKEYQDLQDQFTKAMATAAHHQNLSKYYQNEYEKMIKYKSQGLIEELLPILDSFEFAFKSEPNSEEAKSYRVGFEYLHKMLIDTLVNEGLEIITPKINDEFDSEIMHVVEAIETLDETLVNKVSQVMLNGYKLKDRLIRPSGVKVYTLKKENNEEAQTTNEKIN